jgi:hypothetical protein
MNKSLLLKDEPNIVSLSNAMFTNGELSLRKECPHEWANECFSEKVCEREREVKQNVKSANSKRMLCVAAEGVPSLFCRIMHSYCFKLDHSD